MIAQLYSSSTLKIQSNIISIDSNDGSSTSIAVYHHHDLNRFRSLDAAGRIVSSGSSSSSTAVEGRHRTVVVVQGIPSLWVGRRLVPCPSTKCGGDDGRAVQCTYEIRKCTPFIVVVYASRTPRTRTLPRFLCTALTAVALQKNTL